MDMREKLKGKRGKVKCDVWPQKVFMVGTWPALSATLNLNFLTYGLNSLCPLCLKCFRMFMADLLTC